MTNSEISVFGVDDTTDRAMFWPARDLRVGRATVDTTALADRMEEFAGSLRTVLGRLPRFVGDFEVDQIVVSAEISAKGKVSLLGSGGEVGGKGGIMLTFRRKHDGAAELVGVANAEDADDDENADDEARDPDGS